MESEQTRMAHTDRTNGHLSYGLDRFYNTGPHTPGAHRDLGSKAFLLTNSTDTGLRLARDSHLHLLGRHCLPPRKCRPSALPCRALRHLRPPQFASRVPTALHSRHDNLLYLQRRYPVPRWTCGPRCWCRRHLRFDDCYLDGHCASSSTTEIQYVDISFLCSRYHHRTIGWRSHRTTYHVAMDFLSQLSILRCWTWAELLRRSFEYRESYAQTKDISSRLVWRGTLHRRHDELSAGCYLGWSGVLLDKFPNHRAPCPGCSGDISGTCMGGSRNPNPFSKARVIQQQVCYLDLRLFVATRFIGKFDSTNSSISSLSANPFQQALSSDLLYPVLL